MYNADLRTRKKTPHSQRMPTAPEKEERMNKQPTPPPQFLFKDSETILVVHIHQSPQRVGAVSTGSD